MPKPQSEISPQDIAFTAAPAAAPGAAISEWEAAKGETLREWEAELKRKEVQLNLKETSLSELESQLVRREKALLLVDSPQNRPPVMVEASPVPQRHSDANESPCSGTVAAQPPSIRADPNTTLKVWIFKTVDDPSFSPLAQNISVWMMLIIFISTVCFVLESEVCTTAECINGFLPFNPAAEVFYWIEWVTIIFFTGEYLVRLATCGDGVCSRLRFIARISNLIDLCAWLPFWVSGFSQDPPFAKPTLGQLGGGGAAFVRAIRLVRVFRVFRWGRYSLGIKVFAQAAQLSVAPMIILAVSGVVAMVILSSVIWMVERPEGSFVDDDLLFITGRSRPEPDKYGMQDICYGTIPKAAWWVLTTMTTVGYGDCSPITGVGKMVGVLTMMAGIIVLALPITVRP